MLGRETVCKRVEMRNCTARLRARRWSPEFVSAGVQEMRLERQAGADRDKPPAQDYVSMPPGPPAGQVVLRVA